MFKQNRALGLLAIFALGILCLVLYRNGELFSNGDEARVLGVQGKAISSAQELMGDADPVQYENEAAGNGAQEQEQKAFSEILVSMAECLQIKMTTQGKALINIETIFAATRAGLGEPIVSDRWMNWHFHNKEGQERRLRLEVTENSEGVTGRELHSYAVDRENLPVPLELEKSKRYNPSDEVISQILKENEVFYKEKAGVGLYPTGERIEYVEKNETLSEIEFHKGDQIFRCSALKSARETCLCVK